MHGRKAIALAMVTLGAVGVTQAHAAQTFDASCDTLEAVLATQAQDGDTVRFSGVACERSFTISRDVTLVAATPGAGFKGVVNTRSLVIDGGTTVTLDGLRFTGLAGGVHGGGVSYGVDQRPDGGGAGTSKLVVRDSDFEGITSFPHGGGLFVDDADAVELTGSSFTDDVAGVDGGGAYLTGRNTGRGEPWLTVSGTTFMDNRAGAQAEGPAYGGGLRIITKAARGTQRGATNLPPADARLTGNVLDGNAVGPFGGGRGAGGGAAFENTDVTSEDDMWTNNLVDSMGNPALGGGVYVDGRNFTAINGVFAGNRVGNVDGGGPAAGGGIAYAQGTLTLVHSTVAGNTALGPQASGPGIWADQSSETSFGPLDLDRSIVWGSTIETGAVNRDDAADDLDVDPGQFQPSRSLFCRQAYRAAAATGPDDEGNICTDPQLKEPEEGDVHLTAGSPAVDAVGTDPYPDPPEGGTQGRLASRILVPQDFEGDARPQGAAADMGADELLVPKQQTQTPTDTTQTQQPGGQAPSGGVLGQTQTQPQPQGTPNACSSKRFFRIVLRKKKGRVYRSARIVVNGQKVRVTRYKGRPSTRIDLRRFGYQTIRVQITAKLATGRTLRGSRTYHPCRPSLDDGRPPKL